MPRLLFGCAALQRTTAPLYKHLSNTNVLHGYIMSLEMGWKALGV